MKRLAINSTENNHLCVARMMIWFARPVVAVTVGVSLCGCALHRPPPLPTIVDQALPKATPLPPAWDAAPNAENVTGDWVKSFQDHGL